MISVKVERILFEKDFILHVNKLEGQIESLDMNPQGSHIITIDSKGNLILSDVQTNICSWNQVLEVPEEGGSLKF